MDFARMMDGLRGMVDGSPAEAVRAVLDKSGYKKALETSGQSEDQERLANIEEMITVAEQFMQNQPDGTVNGFLENVALSSSIDGYDKDSNCVSVMTLHAAKGLEFPVVFMVALEEGILPSSFALPGGPGDTTNTKEIEEERRLAFVGMTRAMHELCLGYCHERSFRGMTRFTMPSRFLSELDEARGAMELIDLTRMANRRSVEPEPWDFLPQKPKKVEPIPVKPKAVMTSLAAMDPTRTTTGPVPAVKEGSLVKHPNYGVGKVVEISGQGVLRRVKIQFKTAGVRSFILDKVQLEVLPPGTRI
jgi:DNA helicase-2/ATP-dependent DNA helicase PcrA